MAVRTSVSQKRYRNHPSTPPFPVAVHISGHVGDLTQRRIEALGARLLELPISADEIEVELHRTVKVKVSGIETVTWGQAAPEAVKSRGPQRSGAPKAPAKSGGEIGKLGGWMGRASDKGRRIRNPHSERSSQNHLPGLLAGRANPGSETKAYDFSYIRWLCSTCQLSRTGRGADQVRS